MSRSERILVVDDEPSICSFIEDYLTMEGYSVERAGTVDDALPVLTAGRFDLVLCDLRMPGLPWELVCERIHSWEHGEIPVILMSGSGFISDSSLANFKCIRGRIAKPFRLKEMLQWVEDALNKGERSS